MISTLKNKKVIVTEATSFLNSLLVKELLTLKSYDVIAVVDGKKKSCFLSNLDGAEDRLTIIKDEGNLKYEELFKDAYGVFHSITTPSTIDSKQSKDYSKDIIQPNIEKTVSFMDSVSSSDSIKKVILTSSMDTALDTTAVDLYKRKNSYNEGDWNTSVSKKENPEEFANYLSEKVAREYKFKNCSNKYELITINPSFVIGKGLKESDMNKHLNVFKKALSGETDPKFSNRMIGIIDVEDVVKANIKALESTNNNDSQRYLMANHVTSFHGFSTLVKELTNLPMSKNTPRKSIHNFRIASTSTFKLDTPYIDIKNTIINCINYLRNKGELSNIEHQTTTTTSSQ